MKRTACILPIFFLSFIFPAFGLESPEFTIQMEIETLDEAKAPYFIADKLILTYKEDYPIRFVGAVFEHEMEQGVRMHPFIKNENDTFILVYPIQRDIGIDSLRYRIIVDGLWMADPHNPRTERDRNGIPRSIVSIPGQLTEITTSPVTLPDGRIRFIYKGPPGRTVYLAGDFNDWDPFMHRLRVTSEPDTYELTLRLLPGDHYYYFISDGLRILDPLNRKHAEDFEGFTVSHYYVEGDVQREEDSERSSLFGR